MTRLTHRVVLLVLALLLLLVGLPLASHLTPNETDVALALPLDTDTPTATIEASVTPTETATATLAASTTPTVLASTTTTQTPTVTVTTTPTGTPNYPLFLPLIEQMPEDAPSAPYLATSTVNTTVTVTWSFVPNARAYTLWLATSPSLADAHVVYNGDAQSYTTTLSPGVYYFLVQARNAWGATPSNLASAHVRGGITGRVTQGGQPAAAVEIWLRFYDGQNFSTVATIYTDSNGYYEFFDLPSLAPGQLYYVRYENTALNPARLVRWNSFRINSYTAGFTAWGGDFDIQNVTLITPASGTTTKLPVTFSWAGRNTGGDAYSFFLFDPNNAEPLYDSGIVSGASYTLSALPSGFSFSKPYGWSVRVYNNPQDPFNYGTAYYYHSITFQR